jgi:serine/alanine racemase
MPAIKADAYGHGAILVARELNRLGVHAFCVASAQEGVCLRKARVRGEILVLGYTHPTDFHLLRRYRLTQTAIDRAYAEALNRYGHRLRVHAAIDTGMRRLGERAEHADDILALFRLPNLRVTGIFTHLCVSDGTSPADRAFTLRQARALEKVVRDLAAHGVRRPKTHLLASSGVLHFPELGGDYARVGIALYGILSTRAEVCPVALKPVLSLKARVASVRVILEGEGAGYGLSYIARQDGKIAALAIGYADGVPRALSGGTGKALIRGRIVPIIGRICMDQTLVDVTAVPDVRSGDIAVLIGADGYERISAYDLAEAAGTITNEILSRLGARLERRFV